MLLSTTQMRLRWGWHFFKMNHIILFFILFLEKIYAAYSIIAPNGLQHTENLLKSYNYHLFKKNLKT